MLSVQSHDQSYNSLSTVFDADMQLQSAGRDRSVEELLDVIIDFDLEEVVGLRLLHRHNDLYPSEAMIESAVVDKDGFSLITRAQPATVIDDSVVPNSWMLTASGFVPMEFSRATLLRAPSISPATYPDFFAALAKRLETLGLASLIGPTLASSDFVESNRPPNAEVMLELSALDERANVLRYIAGDVMGGNQAIETHWCVAAGSKTPKTPSKPRPADIKKTNKVCKRICPYVQDPPVHQGTFVHT
jgi:hypothetical protein